MESSNKTKPTSEILPEKKQKTCLWVLLISISVFLILCLSISYIFFVPLSSPGQVAFLQGQWDYLIGNYPKALEYLSKSLELDPLNKFAYEKRGDSYHQLKEYDLAIEDYSYALEIEMNWPKVYNKRGKSYFELRQFEEAILDFDLAIKLDPNFKDAYYNRALSYFEMEIYQKALNDFEKVLELDPNHQEANYYFERINKFLKE